MKKTPRGAVELREVPDCQYVVRFDSFHTVKSHVQGAGRARCTAGAIAFYFDNLPEVEEQKRSVVDAIVRGDEVSEAALNQAITADETQGTAGEGEGEGHTWSAESTQWDYATNASFRGSSELLRELVEFCDVFSMLLPTCRPCDSPTECGAG